MSDFLLLPGERALILGDTITGARLVSNEDDSEQSSGPTPWSSVEEALRGLGLLGGDDPLPIPDNSRTSKAVQEGYADRGRWPKGTDEEEDDDRFIDPDGFAEQEDLNPDGRHVATVRRVTAPYTDFGPADYYGTSKTNAGDRAPNISHEAVGNALQRGTFSVYGGEDPLPY
jgi:hypothetical protein